MADRVITLAHARAQYPNRFTMEHMPSWARAPLEVNGESGRYYAPQYRSDLEWYANTIFPGEEGLHRNSTHCQSTNQTWPLGQFLEQPYEVPAKV